MVWTPINHDFSALSSESYQLAQAPEAFRERPLRKRGARRLKLMEEINLSDDQKNKLAAIRDEYKEQIQSLRQQMHSERQKLRNLMAETVSETEIRDQHQQVAALGQSLHNLRFESMLRMRKVLTPEQRSQFVQLMKQHRHRGERGARERFPDSPQ